MSGKRKTNKLLLSTFSIKDLILTAIDRIKTEDSKQIITILDESRNMLRNSYDDFKHDQEEYRKQLEAITLNKEAAMHRRKGTDTDCYFRLDVLFVFVKKMPFHLRCSCDRNVISKVLPIFVRIPV
mgnify:FL=1